MRKSSAALSVIALSALALTGCSAAPSFDGASCDRSPSGNLGDAVQVSGDLGAARAELAVPVQTSGVEFADVIVGDGPVVTSSAQASVVDVTYYDGASGDKLQEGTALWDAAMLKQQAPGMEAVLTCVTEGSRVVASLPDGAGGTVVAVVDVLYTALPKAEGHDVFNTANNLPSVVRAPDGRPGVIIPDGAAPTKTVVETLIEGEGDVVGDGVPLYQATAVGWNDRAVQNTTWDGVAPVGLDALPAEVATAVQKATVGSQLLVVIPADGDATAFVVDVLGVIPPELLG